METWDVINSYVNGPYAIRTLLGWVLNGPLARDDDALEQQLPFATANRISLCKLEKILKDKYNHEFNEKTGVEKEISREDHRSLEIAEQSAILQIGRNFLKLPFKKKELFLPNKFAIAKQRMQGLKKRLLNNKDLHQEYAK